MQFKNKYCWRKGTNMPGGAGQDSHRWFGLVFIALWRQASCLPLHSQVVWVTLFSSTAIPAWDWPCHSCPQDKMSTPSSFCCSHTSCCIPQPVGSPQPSQLSWATLPAMGFQWDSLRVSFLQGRSVMHTPSVSTSNSFTNSAVFAAPPAPAEELLMKCQSGQRMLVCHSFAQVGSVITAVLVSLSNKWETDGKNIFQLYFSLSLSSPNSGV